MPPRPQPSAPPDPWEFVSQALQGNVTILDLLDHLPIYTVPGTASWRNWRIFLASLYGIKLSPEEMEVFTRYTGRKLPQEKKAREVWLIAGRRARKSAISALVMAWECAFRDHTKHKAPGMPARGLIMSESIDRGREVFNYCKAIFEQTHLRALLAAPPNTERIPLWNDVNIELSPCRAVAGRSNTTVCAVLDEIAFFRTDEEYANPDEAIVSSIMPSMSTVTEPILMAVSSPYARKGLLWKNYQEHYAHEQADTLVWKAPSVDMHAHPGVVADRARAYEKDPASALAEYDAEFRTDIEAYITLDLLNACTSSRPGLLPVPRDPEGKPLHPGRRYYAFVDPSGGGSDQFTLAISHYEQGTKGEAGKGVLDYLAAWQPRAGASGADKALSTEQVVREVAAILKTYGITRVKGDHYAGMYPRDMFASNGITYLTSTLTRSAIYLEFRPLLLSGRVDLPSVLKTPAGDLALRMRNQFMGLERRTGGSGKDIVDHGKGKHDDLCFVGGTRIATPAGDKLIEEMQVGDTVLVPAGVGKVVWAGQTGLAVPVKRHGLTGTPNHPVFVWGVGDVPLNALTGASRCVRLSLCTQILWTLLKLLNSSESSTDSWGSAAITSASREQTLAGAVLKACMSPSGSTSTTGWLRRATTFITSMATSLTTTLKTWAIYRILNIAACLRTLLRNSEKRIASKFALLTTEGRELGMRLLKAALGTASTQRPHDEETNLVPARCVDRRFYPARAIPICVPSAAETRQGGSGESAQLVPVYNIEVACVNVYYANGILVHNCNVVAGSLIDAVPLRHLEQTKEAEAEPWHPRDRFREMTKKANYVQPARPPLNPYARQTAAPGRRF